MSSRTYRQDCGLAVALDAVGKRWALLIVRDLVPGPRRFTDLFQGLPGISSDILADRLRVLETAGVVRQRAIRHPAPAKLFELTERGYELAKIAVDLARWGGPLLADEEEDVERAINARWALTLLAARYHGGFSDGDVHIILDDQDELTLSFAGDRARLRYGHTSGQPLLVIAATTPAMLELLHNGHDATSHDPDLDITGRTDLLLSLLSALSH